MSILSEAVGGFTTFLGKESTTLMKSASLYNADLNGIDSILKEFQGAGLLKSDLFISIYPENKFEQPSVSKTSMLLTGVSVPRDIGITWKSDASQFFHTIPQCSGVKSVQVRFIVPGIWVENTAYYKAFSAQFTLDGLLKLKRDKYDATLGYYNLLQTPSYIKVMSLKDIRLTVPMPSDLDQKSTELVEWSGEISYDDYEMY